MKSIYDCHLSFGVKRSRSDQKKTSRWTLAFFPHPTPLPGGEGVTHLPIGVMGGNCCDLLRTSSNFLKAGKKRNRRTTRLLHPVFPAKAGIQSHQALMENPHWIPACAGMTGRGVVRFILQRFSMIWIFPKGECARDFPHPTPLPGGEGVTQSPIGVMGGNTRDFGNRIIACILYNLAQDMGGSSLSLGERGRVRESMALCNGQRKHYA